MLNKFTVEVVNIFLHLVNSQPISSVYFKHCVYMSVYTYVDMCNISNIHTYVRHIYIHIYCVTHAIGYKSRIDEFKKESQRLLSKQHFDSAVIIEKTTLVEQHYTELTQLASLRKNHLTESKQLHEFKRLVF